MSDDAMSAKPKYDREACLRAFAADMQRRATILERDIEAEEVQFGRHDPADVAYPLTAKSMRDRRQKISYTIATLQSAMAAAESA
jgi:hypothetical protein